MHVILPTISNIFPFGLNLLAFFDSLFGGILPRTIDLVSGSIWLLAQSIISVSLRKILFSSCSSAVWEVLSFRLSFIVKHVGCHFKLRIFARFLRIYVISSFIWPFFSLFGGLLRGPFGLMMAFQCSISFVPWDGHFLAMY